MTVTVFGATGKTGIPLIQQALESGHEVKAFVRTPAKFTLTHPKLTLVQGDAMNAADVDRAVKGSDAVVSVLGHGKGTPADMQTVAIGNIIKAMKQHDVKRLVSLTGAGVRDANDKPKFFDHFIRTMLKLISGKVLEDAVNHAEKIRSSGLDWTIVRGPMLTEGARGEYKVGYVGEIGARASRENVAAFMLKTLQNGKYIGKAPAISEA